MYSFADLELKRSYHKIKQHPPTSSAMSQRDSKAPQQLSAPVSALASFQDSGDDDTVTRYTTQKTISGDTSTEVITKEQQKSQHSQQNQEIPQTTYPTDNENIQNTDRTTDTNATDPANLKFQTTGTR